MSTTRQTIDTGLIRAANRPAFTLLELLVATVLGAMLTAALAATLRTAFAQTKRIDDARSAEAPRRPLLQQLQRDITNADSFAIVPDSLILAGAIHRDPLTLAPTQRPATVRYVVTRLSGTNVLLRVQKSGVPAQPLGNESLEIAWVGVGQFAAAADVVGLFETSDDPPLAPAAEDALQVSAVGLLPMSPTLDVILTDEDGNVIFAQTFHHHWEGA